MTKLYNPRDYTPEEIKYVQALLQAVQRRPEGWQVADGLLEAGDTNHRFFGALTFTVKINQSWYVLPLFLILSMHPGPDEISLQGTIYLSQDVRSSKRV